jgi:hypothetical protein
LKISIDIDTLTPAVEKKKTPYEKVESLARKIEDPHYDSLTEWNVLLDAYSIMKKKKKLSEEDKHLMACMEDVISRIESGWMTMMTNHLRRNNHESLF